MSSADARMDMHGTGRARHDILCEHKATGKREATLREEPRLACPLPPHGRKKHRPTRPGKAARIKKPLPGMVGVSPYKLPSLSLERTSQRHVGQVSWLAATIYSLHLPKMKHLSGLCRF